MLIPRIKYITPKRLGQITSARNREEYRRWRESVLARDEYCCQWPGCRKDDKLEVHHIKKFSTFRHLRYEPYNGITLCSEHHDKLFGREEMYELDLLRIVKARMESVAKLKKLQPDQDNS